MTKDLLKDIGTFCDTVLHSRHKSRLDGHHPFTGGREEASALLENLSLLCFRLLFFWVQETAPFWQQDTAWLC